MKKKQIYYAEESISLLEFLLHKIKGQSRNSIKHLLSRGQVLVNGTCQRQFDFQLSAGQQVTILPQAKGAELSFPILYEDERLIAVDKPAGLLSVATERERERTAYRQVSDYLRARDGLPRIFVLHRLDRDTSGVLVFAKDEMFRNALQENWNDLVKKRGYYAVVEGESIPTEGICRSLLQENGSHKVYTTSYGDGKEAVTRYQIITQRRGYSLLDVEIETGRKNQIRVHLSELGYPVAGDKKYGARSDPMRRMGLHAYQLILTAPDGKMKYSFVAPAPQSFHKIFPGIPF